MNPLSAVSLLPCSIRWWTESPWLICPGTFFPQSRCRGNNMGVLAVAAF